VLIAIDGHSAAGTSTLADELSHRLAATVVRADDFYRDMRPQDRWTLGPEQGVDLYFDWQRMRQCALEPLMRGRSARYRAFDWETGSGLSSAVTELAPAPVVIVDGVYSARPELSDLYDLTVLVETPAAVRLRRIEDRGHGNEAWWSRWEAAEQLYFSRIRLPEHFGIVLPGC